MKPRLHDTHTHTRVVVHTSFSRLRMHSPCFDPKQLRQPTAHSQLGKARPAHGRRDGLDGGEQRVEQKSQTPRGSLDLSLLVQDEASQGHRVHVYFLLRERWGLLRHDCFSVAGKKVSAVV